MVGLEYRKLQENFGTGSGLMDSMQRAFEKISRLNPSVIQKLKPQGIEGFAQETMNSLKQTEPKIVNF